MGLVLLFGLVVITLVGAAEEHNLKYKEVIEGLREKSDPDTIPVDSNNPKPVRVGLDLSLLYIVTADDTAEVLEVIFRQKITWSNPALAWRQSRPDVDNVTIPLRFLWSPDTAPTNGISDQEVLSPELAIVSSDGDITYEPQIRLAIHSDLKGLKSPSGARVTIEYESWTNDQTKLQFESPTDSSLSVSEFESNRFQVSDPQVEKRTKWHPSRPRLHDALEFSFVLKKVD